MSNEKRGSSRFCSQGRGEIDELNAFIEKLELNDIPLIGRKFTWFRARG